MNRFHLGRGGPDLDMNRQEPQPMDMGPRLRTPMPPQHSPHPHAPDPRLIPQRDRYEDEGYAQAASAPYAQQPTPGIRLSPFTRTTAQEMPQHAGFDRHPPQPQAQRYWRDEDAYYEPPYPRENDHLAERASPMRFIFAISGLVLIAGISWFAYRWATADQGEPPLIQAEAGPYKVRPENPGGMSIPHQDKLIYGRLTPHNEQPVERLLPPQEQAAVPMQATQGYAQAVATPQEGYTPPYPPAPQGQQPQQPIAVQPPQGGAEGAYPSAGPSQAPYGVEGPTSPAAPGAATPASYAPAAQGSAPTPTPAAMAPTAASAPQSAAAPRASEAAAPQSKPMPSAKATEAGAPTAKESKEATTTGGSFYLQMATLPSEAAAQQEGERLKKKYASQLGNVKVAVKTYNMPDGRKYRILVGPYKTKAAATAKCGEVGGNCQIKQIPG